MLRRLLAQFGLTTLVVALGAGAVFADTAPVATPPSNDPGQTVVSTDASSVVVDTTHTATTTVGASVGGSDSSGPSSTPPTATPPSSSGSGDSTNPTATTTDPTTLSTNLLSLNTTTGVMSPGHPGDPAATASTTPTTSPASRNSLVASLQRAAYLSGITPLEPVLATGLATGLGHPVTPHHSSLPVALLDQLHILLISTLVPAISFIPGLVHGAANSQAGLAVAIILVLSCLALLELTGSANTYTARLRRSGFLGAARSDVATLLPFATPREMSSIGAGAPG